MTSCTTSTSADAILNHFILPVSSSVKIIKIFDRCPAKNEITILKIINHESGENMEYRLDWNHLSNLHHPIYTLAEL